jgi:NTE family protein
MALGKKKCILAFLLIITISAIAAERPSVALVLGGGGAKGFAHIAVLELLEEMEIPVDMVIGVSAGAIIGGLYSVGYSPEMIKNAIFDMDWAAIFLDTPVSPFENELGAGDLLFRYDSRAIEKGLSPGQMAYALLKSLTSRIPSYIDFDDLPIPFRAGVVRIPEGNVELISQGDLAEAIRASISMPGLFDPFDIDGNLYIDGGTLDNLPLQAARDMGFDIVIASELFAGFEEFSYSPLDVPEFILSLYFNTISREQHHLADAVLEMDVHNFSIWDFHKSHDIYSQTRAQKDYIRPKLEKIREMISSAEKPPLFSYSDLPLLTPDSLRITGALPRDKAFIEKYFSRNIEGKPLDPANLADFIQMVFETGNYRFVTARIDTRQGKTELELLLQAENYRRVVFLFGGNYQGIFSEAAINKLSLQGCIQIHGLTGAGSVLSLGASWVNVRSVGMRYLQPLSPRTFLTAQTEITQDNDIIVSGFLRQAPEENRLTHFTGGIMGGILISRNSVFKAGPLFFASNLFDTPTDEYLRNKALGFGTTLSFNSLDNNFIPSRGIYAGLENYFYLLLPYGSPGFFNLISLELRGGLPLGRRLSIAAGAFAGTDLSFNLSGFEGLTAGFTAFDRHFFPNIYSSIPYYSNKAATNLALQFKPWENLTILGGQLIFSLSASAGELLNEWEDFAFDNLIWNASFNVGLRITNSFGLLLRLGVGSSGSTPPVPFLAFDMGQTIRSGIKPGY